MSSTLDNIYDIVLDIRNKTEKAEITNNKIVSSLDKYNNKYINDHYLANLINDLVNLYDDLDDFSSSKFEEPELKTSKVDDRPTLFRSPNKEDVQISTFQHDYINQVKRLVEDIFIKNSIEIIDPKCKEQFDAKFHQVKDAIVTDDENLKKTITKTHKKGFAIYDLNDKSNMKVIRYARVSVYK